MFEVGTGMLYLAVEMPNKTHCKPSCATTVSIVQDADGKLPHDAVAPVHRASIATKPVPYHIPCTICCRPPCMTMTVP